jgi:hypothetical protein
LDRKIQEKQEQPNSQKTSLDYKTLIKKIAESGDLCVLGMKGTCKTTLLMHLARTIKEDANNHLIVFETFPKWIYEFDSIPYMIIKNSDVQPKENTPYLEDGASIIQWSKDFKILNAETVIEFLKTNKDCIFLIECLEMERISAFMTFVIYQKYRRQYLRAKAETLNTLNKNYWFLCEEAHNLMDSTILAKTQFNKLRKMQAEFRNLKMHLICVTIRLQNLSPKIRSTMSLILSRVSLDDYQLKIRQLLRNSEFKNIITELPKGEFVFPELDQKLTTEPFQQIGKPFEYHTPEQTQPQAQFIDPWKAPKTMGFWQALKMAILGENKNPKSQNDNDTDDKDDKEDSQGDGLMTLENGDELFPEEF